MYKHCFWYLILHWFHDLVIQKKKPQNNRTKMDNTFKNYSIFKGNKLLHCTALITVLWSRLTALEYSNKSKTLIFGQWILKVKEMTPLREKLKQVNSIVKLQCLSSQLYIYIYIERERERAFSMQQTNI